MLKRFLAQPAHWFQIVLVALLLMPTLAHAYTGHFARPMADDYCFANTVFTHGVGGAVVYWYMNWTGGYGSVLTQSIAAQLGSNFNGLLPALLLLLWLASVILSFYLFARLVNLHDRWFTAFWLGGLFVYGAVEGSPNVLQSVYWTSASLSYTAPLVMVAWYAALVLYMVWRPLPELWRLALMLLAMALTFLAGGASETFMMLQGALLGLATLIASIHLSLRRAVLPMLIAGLVGALMAIVITVIAPGNNVRYSRFNHPLPLPELLTLTFNNTRELISLSISVYAPVPLAVSFVASAWLGWQITRFQLRWRTPMLLVVASAVLGFALIFATLAPAAYGMTAMPPRRAFIVPQTVLIGLAIFWGLLLGLLLQKVYHRLSNNPIITSAENLIPPTRGVGWYIGAIAVGVVLNWGPVSATSNILTNVPTFSQYAAEWDTRDQFIRAAVQQGSTDLTVKPFSFDLEAAAQVKPIGSNPSDGFNPCAAQYYGLKTLKTE